MKKIAIVKEDTIWRQWFTGWMTESDLPWDRMFYSFSEDSGSTWSNPVSAFTIENVQVNDPTVIRLRDATNSRYYYQIYYTYYPSGLGDPTNYIVVSTSLDGINWQESSHNLSQGEVKEVAVVELTPRSVSGSAMCFPEDFTFQRIATLAQSFRFENAIGSLKEIILKSQTQ